MLVTLLLGLITGLGIGWLLHRRRAYQPIRWWESYRLEQQHHQAEYLRNGPLQDLFGLRRNLELCLMSQDLLQSAMGQELLAQLKVASEQLEQYSDRLSSPFDLAEDGGASLPLALRHVLLQGELQETSVGQLQSQANSIQAKLELPQQWNQTNSLGSLVLLSFVEQLTQHYRKAAQEQQQSGQQHSIDAQLIQQSNHAEFKLCFCPPLDTTIFAPSEAKQLCQAFRLLSGGQCQVEQSETSEFWHFAWS